MTFHELIRNRKLGWSLYSILIVCFCVIFGQLLLTHEESFLHFNQPIPYVEHHLIEFNIRGIDYATNELSCEFEIPKDFGKPPQIAILAISSLETGATQDRPDSTNADISFTYPSRNEMVDLVATNQAGDLTPLLGIKHPFQFRVHGNKALYPFDTYSANFEVLVVTVRNQPVNFEIKLNEALSDLGIREITHYAVGKKVYFSVELIRSSFIRLFTILIYSFAFVYLLFISFKKDIKELLLQSLGYLLALWGIRDIISGRVGYFPTVVDYITLAYFSLLLLILTARYLHQFYDAMEG